LKRMLQSSVSCVLNVLQVFYTDVAKVDWDVTHVVKVVNVCCKLLFSMFHLFFDVFCKCICLDVAYVSAHMMQVFYLDIT
jgi:hypothetical protein